MGSLTNGLDRLRQLADTVSQHGACKLPGISIDDAAFVQILRRAVFRGYVTREQAEFVEIGLRFGFDLGVDATKLKGRRHYRNYPTALQAQAAVTDATRARVDAGKTVKMCRLEADTLRQLPWRHWRKFPVGAVPKALEPGKMRPFSDHSRTGLNECTEMGPFRHSLRTYQEIAEYLRYGYSMRVGDVDAAFPLLPVAPSLWPYFLFTWFDVHADDGAASLEGAAPECLYVHIAGDFGTAGMPGTWKIFFSDAVVGIGSI